MSIRIVRSSKRAGFTMIPNATLRDKRLSLRARGLLGEILSNSDGWASADPSVFAEGTKEGRDAVRAAFAELKALGYMVQRKVRGADGRLVTETTVYDVPQGFGGGGVNTGSPGAGFQRPVPPAHMSNGAGRTGRGFSAPGDDQGKHNNSAGPTGSGISAPGTDQPKHESSQVAPDAGFQGPIEDQGEDHKKTTKKISQSAQEREAARYVRDRYDGLTDRMLTHIFEVAYQRAERAGRPVQNLRRYIASWAEGDLADVVSAALDIAARHETAAAPALTVVDGQPLGRAARRAVIDACRLCDPNGITLDDRPRRCDHQPGQPTQLPLVVAVDHDAPAEYQPADEHQQRTRDEIDRHLAPFREKFQQQRHAR